jgi:hypothetical protein
VVFIGPVRLKYEEGENEKEDKRRDARPSLSGPVIFVVLLFVNA